MNVMSRNVLRISMPYYSTWIHSNSTKISTNWTIITSYTIIVSKFNPSHFSKALVFISTSTIIQATLFAQHSWYHIEIGFRLSTHHYVLSKESKMKWKTSCDTRLYSSLSFKLALYACISGFALQLVRMYYTCGVVNYRHFALIKEHNF